jgi:hypothetical protein
MDWAKLFGEKNIGKLDRAIRILLGIILFILAIILPQAGPVLRTIFGLLGVVGIITGIMGHCLIYSLLRWSTLRE